VHNADHTRKQAVFPHRQSVATTLGRENKGRFFEAIDR
jgi:hypothetical protein